MRYEAHWDSLAQHPTPEWLLDAKFGIYTHWGPYSVPAYGNEWYGKRMYEKRGNSGIHQHHVQKYGDPSKFGYKDFIPLFKAEKWDPGHWADLIARSGAKYAGTCVIHHDGFAMWHSRVNRWNAGEMGPKRDIFGELVNALRQVPGMKIIATFHHIRTFDWFLPDEETIEEGRRAGWDLFDPAYADFYWNRFTASFDDFLAQWQRKVKECIDTYRPDVVWFDGGHFRVENVEEKLLDVLAHYLNEAEREGREVDVGNKFGFGSRRAFNFPEDFGVLTYEEGRDRPVVVERPWIDDMKISTNSWGYIEGQTYRPSSEILHGLIDRTSRGGGLLLSLCPKADGTLTKEQERVLAELGDWLGRNGEAIYGTRPWKIPGEGPVEKFLRPRGSRTFWVYDTCDARDIRFTAKGDTLYALTLGWPEDRRIAIESLGRTSELCPREIASVTLVGSNEPVTWTRLDGALVVQLPEHAAPEPACALRIEFN